MMDQHVLSLSYGKDSLACIFAIKALGWPLDRIIHAEVWATDTIPADLPPMVEFKAKADEIIYELTGIRVEHLCATRNGEKLTYEKMFYHIPKRKPGGKFSEGSSAGFPYTKGAWCNDRLKTNPLDAVSGNGGGQSQGSHSQSEAGARSSKTGLILGYPIRGGNGVPATSNAEHYQGLSSYNGSRILQETQKPSFPKAPLHKERK